MMKKVFLDTNILMDFVDRRELREYAETIIELGKNGVIQLFASYLSFANMGYILRHRSQDERYAKIRQAREIGAQRGLAPLRPIPSHACPLWRAGI